MPAIAHLLYYGGIGLRGPPAPRAALIGAARPCSRGDGRFTATAHIPQRVAGAPSPGRPRRLIDIRGRTCRFCAVAAGLPAPLAGPPCRGEGGASSGLAPRGRQPAPGPDREYFGGFYTTLQMLKSSPKSCVTGPVAQPGRALGLHPRGPGFKSRPVHQTWRLLSSKHSGIVG